MDKQGSARSPIVQDNRHILTELKARMTPHFVGISPPEDLTQDELRKRLLAQLSPGEYALIPPALTGTPEMNQWAEKITRGAAQDDIQTARRLFDELTRHSRLRNPTNPNVGHSWPNAEVAFKRWCDPKAALDCQDYTSLYLTLARHLGLRAYCVLVTKDYRSRPVYHVCPGVFVPQKGTLLVDPTYNWFGAPHSEYQVLDQLQLTAFIMSLRPEVAMQKTAVKVAPRLPMTHFNLSMLLASQGRWSDAERSLQAGLQLEQGSWLALYAQGFVEAGQKKWDAAAEHLIACLIMNPDYPAVHYELSQVFRAQGKIDESCRELRAYLSAQTEPETNRERP